MWMGAQDKPKGRVARMMEVLGFSTFMFMNALAIFTGVPNPSAYGCSVQSPIGPLRIVCSDEHLLSIHFNEVAEPGTPENELCQEVRSQLGAYFSGELREFSLPLAPAGSEFQKRVWQVLLELPFGETTTYLSLARKLGDEKVIRAAANANGKNPIPIVIPCHRVIGSDGSLTGYAGGLGNKRWLLQHEGCLQPELF